MIYVSSDLHGYPLSRFQKLLSRAGFSDSDYLFVLGDVIDRNGDGGIELLQWMSLQPNVGLILGNHEAMLLACSFLFEEITSSSIDSLTGDRIDVLATWISNGAEPTLKALRALHSKAPDAVEDLLDFLRECPLYDRVTAGGREFLLVHSGLGCFDRKRRLSDYSPDELLWHRPETDERYFDRTLTILGHTPTEYYGCPGRAYRASTWIDIDTGAGHGGAPMLLRLDDMREFYMD